MSVYGYCRISTAKQSIDRQVRNIRAEYPTAHIVQEAYTGTSILRPEWSKLYRVLKDGDTVVFDSVSRMSRNAEEGFSLYEDLYHKGIRLIFLKEHHIGSLEELNDQIQGLTDHQNELKASIREKQNRMKEIIRQRQAIRDYSRTKEVYTQYRESGWTVKFYQEHRQEIENHRNAQAVYSSHDGKMPTLKELTAEYDGLKEQKENDQAALDKLKPKLTDLKHIRYNYEILERDSAPKSNQHVIPKDHHYDEHGADHDDESR